MPKFEYLINIEAERFPYLPLALLIIMKNLLYMCEWGDENKQPSLKFSALVHDATGSDYNQVLFTESLDRDGRGEMIVYI